MVEIKKKFKTHDFLNKIIYKRKYYRIYTPTQYYKFVYELNFIRI